MQNSKTSRNQSRIERKKIVKDGREVIRRRVAILGIMVVLNKRAKTQTQRKNRKIILKRILIMIHQGNSM